jgi:hypothetical protein
MDISRDQNAWRHKNIKIDTGFSERVNKFKYLWTKLMN